MSLQDIKARLRRRMLSTPKDLVQASRRRALPVTPSSGDGLDIASNAELGDAKLAPATRTANLPQRDARTDLRYKRDRSPLVVAVLLNWNKAAETAACIDALSRLHHDNLQIIVVDNGSLEEPLASFANVPVSVHLIRNTRNLGFAGGVNIGIGHALRSGAAYIWLVNNDAQPEPSALCAMLDAMETDSSIGIASPVILNADANDAIEFCGGLWWGNTFHTTDDLALYQHWSCGYPDRIWVVGTAMLLRREAAERIGPFDEKLFAYWEDNDYSVRCVRSGLRNVVVKEAVVRHWSGTPRTNPASKPPHYFYYMARNELLFMRKHLSPTRMARPVWWAVHRQIGQLRRLQDPAFIDAVLLGLWDGLRGKGGAFDGSRHVPSFARRMINRALG